MAKDGNVINANANQSNTCDEKRRLKSASATIPPSPGSELTTNWSWKQEMRENLIRILLRRDVNNKYLQFPCPQMADIALQQR